MNELDLLRLRSAERQMVKEILAVIDTAYARGWTEAKCNSMIARLPIEKKYKEIIRALIAKVYNDEIVRLPF